MEEQLEVIPALDLDRKLNDVFAGRVVRKDLTKLIKEGANVPVYVLEYLLGMYAATDDEESIREGLERVKKILSDNFVRPDEAEKIKSRIREQGQYSIIDKVTVALNPKLDIYEAEFSNLGLKGVPVGSNFVKEFDKLLVGGIWCMVKIDYYFDEEARNVNPFSVSSLQPIQMPNMDMTEIFEGRKQFTTNEWIDVLMRSTGAEFFREMRKRSIGDAYDTYFKLGNNLNQRDTIAVRKTVSGMLKLIYPHGEYTKEDIEEVLVYALEGRRRVKEQLKKIGDMEFYDVMFSYIDKETLEEHYVSVPEQGGGKLIPEGMGRPGHVYVAGHGNSGMIGVFKLENEVVSGTGKFDKSGVSSSRETRESLDTAFRYFTSNSKSISNTIQTKSKDYLMHISDLQGIGLTDQLGIAELIGLCSGALGKPVQEGMVVIGAMTVGGTIAKVEEFANVLQVCVDAGAKKVLIPAASVMDLQTVPPDLLVKVQPVFYSDPTDAVFKALGVS